MSLTIQQILRDPSAHLGTTVELFGWVRSVRNSKEVSFIEFNDGTGFKSLQVVFSSTLSNVEEIEKVTLGSSLRVKGELVASQGGEQSCELQAQEIEVIGLADLSNPIQKKRHTFEYLRTIAHLRPRTNTFLAVFRVRSLVAQAIHEFFQQRDFLYVHTPIITGTDAEGAGEMFRVTTLGSQEKPDASKELLGGEAYLTVSGQLALEPFTLAYRNAYTFGPTFRAENSNTARHAAEFWMIEPEMAFATLEDDMRLAEDMIKFVVNRLFERAPDELAFFNAFIDTGLLDRLKALVNAPFQVMTYTEAIEKLQASGVTFEIAPAWGEDLATEHERYLTDEVVKGPVFVVDYPKGFKAFYMRQNDDGKTVRAMDLLVPGVGELIGGSQREERYDLLKQRMEETGMDLETYAWYLDTRKFGGVPHAGFGLGFERLVMYVTGMKNIRDVIPYPRTPGTLLY